MLCKIIKQQSIVGKLGSTPVSTWSLWQCLQIVTDFKTKAGCTAICPASLPDGLNAFCAHFEVNNTNLSVNTQHGHRQCTADLWVGGALFRWVNTCKETSPDRIPRWVFRECTKQCQFSSKGWCLQWHFQSFLKSAFFKKSNHCTCPQAS